METSSFQLWKALEFLKAAEPSNLPPPPPFKYLVESSFVFKAEGVAAEGELSLGFEALSGS